MENSKVRKVFKKLITEIEDSKNENNKEDIKFLEKLCGLTTSSSVEQMLKRFKELAGLSED